MECFSLYLYGFHMAAEHFKTHLALQIVLSLCPHAKWNWKFLQLLDKAGCWLSLWGNMNSMFIFLFKVKDH